MLTNLEIRNFKRFSHASIELGNPVVFIGPNNSGKTTALQALALWSLGVRRWFEKRGDSESPGKRPGVALNRRDLVAVPIPEMNLLWRNLHVRNVARAEGRPTTQNVRITICVAGVEDTVEWKCGLEFDYANEESLYCRPLRMSERETERMPVPPAAREVRLAYLPPMSGLADREFQKQHGELEYLIGQGKTADVLRNLCYQVLRESESKWRTLQNRLQRLFGIQLNRPELIPERSEITLSYVDQAGTTLDLSSSGRGVQQTLLLLSYMMVRPGSVLLLDEPDAHLEILRQRQIYRELAAFAVEQRSQIVAASHSEVVLKEAAERDVVVAFVGSPHRIDDRGSQLLKSLRDIGFEHYYQAEITGWVLYLEGSTDLAILSAWARTLEHPCYEHLERPFVEYVANQPQKAREHFRGLKEAMPHLRAVLVTDRLGRPLQSTPEMAERAWSRTEIENYLCQPPTLLRYADELAQELAAGPLYLDDESDRMRSAMVESIKELVPPLALENLDDPWWRTMKASDEFLDRLFERFFKRLNIANLMPKSNYHRLAVCTPRNLIDPEIIDVLDTIERIAKAAKPIQAVDE